MSNVTLKGPPGDPSAYRQLLQACIQEKNLSSFYPPGSPVIEQIAQKAPQLISQVISRWKLPKEIANDVVKLALYDIWLYIGMRLQRNLSKSSANGSMQFEEGGERIKDMRLILERVAFAATLFDADGINVRFMNTNLPDNLSSHIAQESQIERLMQGVQFKGLTPMGTSLKKKVIEPLIQQARAGQFRKPVLVIAVTDGQPAGEPQNAVMDAVNEAVRSLPPGGIAFQFAQVGNDQAARAFLGKLDEDPQLDKFIDCTSSKCINEKIDFLVYTACPSGALTWYRLRERARGDGSCQSSCRSDTRSVDPEADARCHRLQLRHPRPKDQRPGWWLRTSSSAGSSARLRRCSLWSTATAKWLSASRSTIRRTPAGRSPTARWSWRLPWPTASIWCTSPR
jgi:hypothetical protein